MNYGKLVFTIGAIETLHPEQWAEFVSKIKVLKARRDIQKETVTMTCESNLFEERKAGDPVPEYNLSWGTGQLTALRIAE